MDSEEWVVVDKSIDVPDKESQIDRKIGFEGTPDPNTGYYCVSILYCISYISNLCRLERFAITSH